MVDYCLSFLNMKKEPFSIRICEEDFWTEPCTILLENGKYYICAVLEILPEIMKISDFFLPESIEKIYALTKKYIEEKSMIPDKHVSIIRCFDLTDTGEKITACRLTGNEDDALFSDIPYLVERGPVYGILKDGKVVSLAGAVIKDGVANIHIETAPGERKKGYAKECLLSLCAYLKSEGIKVLYECRSENEASLRTVMGIGGREICRYVRFIGRK